MTDFLFELGIEEVPVSEIKNIEKQLADKFTEEFENNLIEFNDLEKCSTNSRFMIYIKDIAEKAKDRSEIVVGPSKKIAFDENNQPTIPLKKFLESNGSKVEDIIELEQKKGIYIAIKKETEGRTVPDLLGEIIPKVLSGLNFKKSMVWNKSRVPFVRPIKNILALFNSDLIEIEFAGIESSNLVCGHRLLSEEAIEIGSFKNYIEGLRSNFVIVEAEERREKILEEVGDIEEELNVKVKLDEAMLDYFVYNNEYPVVFTGDFDEKYLEIPPEIISTFMVNEKKLIPVYDSEGNMKNVFVGVSNIPDENRYVTEGNKRVVIATFEDAKFFWDNDRNDDFYSLRDELKNVLFHKKIGNFYEKTERVKEIVDFLTKLTYKDDLGDGLKKAALLCKNDLVTRMVREFPSLQGIMGGLYLREKGENETVWKAVYGHYEPKGYTDEKVQSIEGGLLAIADKIDNVAGFIGTGMKISSSKDPFGIRRDANAILKIIIDLKLEFDLKDLIEFTVDRYGVYDEPREKLVQDVANFFISRVQSVFKEQLDYRYDIVNAVAFKGNLHINKLNGRARDIAKLIENNSLKEITELHKRLKNIVKGFGEVTINPDGFIEEEEKILFDIYSESKEKIFTLIEKGSNIDAFSMIMEMKPIIDGFFDKVLVMADDENLKNNRIALIMGLEKLLNGIADFSQLVD